MTDASASTSSLPSPAELAREHAGEHAGELRIADTRTMRGPSVADLRPAVVVDLRAGRLAEHAPGELPDFVARLRAALPGAFGGEQGEGPASWGDALVHVTLELQRLAGAPPAFGRVTIDAPAEDRWRLVVGYDEEDLVHDALGAGARVLRDCLRGDDPEIERVVAELTEVYDRARPEPGTRAVIDAARRRGIPVRRNEENGAVQLGLGMALRRLESPMSGEPEAIVDSLYPPGAPTTVPVVAITGTNGKTTTTRLIAHLFRDAGFVVGFTTTDGVYLREERLLAGDLTGPFAADMILTHPEVEVAVLETARGGILRAGLGYAECDVGVVLNVTADHLGIGGVDTLEQLADVKAVIPSVVKPTGFAVLSADDPLVAAMRQRTRGTVVYFTTRAAGESALVDEQLARGGIVGRVERGENGSEELVILEGERRERLASVLEVPLTFGGAARFQLENILAASLAAYVQGVPPERIRHGLLGFVPSLALTPGRLNVVETRRGRVILDYAHNVAAIEGLMAFLGAMPAEHRMLVVAVPGDRRVEDMVAVAQRAASMDYVIFKEHHAYRRGRPAGETSRIMADALIATGFPAERVAAIAEEPDAIAHAMELMRPGGVVAILADDAVAVLEQLKPVL